MAKKEKETMEGIGVVEKLDKLLEDENYSHIKPLTSVGVPE